jgi:hypothetical protein
METTHETPHLYNPDPTELIEALKTFMADSCRRISTMNELAVTSVPLVGVDSANYDISRTDMAIHDASLEVARTLEYLQEAMGVALTYPHPESGEHQQILKIGYSTPHHVFHGIVGENEMDPKQSQVRFNPDLVQHRPYVVPERQRQPIHPLAAALSGIGFDGPV